MVFPPADRPRSGRGEPGQYLRDNRREAFTAVGAGLLSGAGLLLARLRPDPAAVDAELLPPGWTPGLDEDGEIGVA
jgi:hypothetical protein